ncbi:DUF5977 domain-containing protein [Chryseobacterium oranimense]|uniref:DUF5977 domain-containing protein n=1 Tax=Chryseobacterium oranimense TaxID=421058 RepID=UPI002236815F|nr:DUF5977 domain-containing protein [Chryseobacterium oranimense]
MRKIILLFSMSIICGGLKSQSYKQAPINFKSPQSSEMEHFGNTPVNLYSGGINLNIPLFSTEIPGTGEAFDLNLAYNSSGFIPSKKSNYVGLNWNLNYGGAITRQINYFADDEPFPSDPTMQNKGGYLTGARAVSALGLTSQSIYDENYPQNTNSHFPYLSVNNKYAELAPDKFNFSFMGVSGYFYIGFDLKPVAVSNDPNLKIDITGLSTKSTAYCKPVSSQIVITDGKGNKYFFGGDYDNLEISYNLGVLNSAPPTVQTPTYDIMGWYLTKVEYNNGRFIIIENKRYGNVAPYKLDNTFCYNQSFPPDDYIGAANPVKQAFFDLNFYISGSRIYPIPVNSGPILSDITHPIHYGPLLANGNFFNTNIVKKVFPEKIIIDSIATIKLNYDEFPAYKSGTNYSLPKYYGYKSYKLSGISVYNNQQKKIKTVGLSYNRIKDYFFLSSVTDSDKKYTLDYYKTGNLPESTTFGVDFWGYWNGKPEDTNPLIPNYAYYIDGNKNTDITGDSRNPNPDLCDVGLLRKIEYPTGGSSSFYYEPHTYLETISRDASSNFFQYLKTKAGIAGGARIKKILDFDTNKYTTRDFKYIKDYNGTTSNKSSGINNSFFSFVTITFPELIYGNGDVKLLNENLYNVVPNIYSSNPVNYSEISELVNNKLYKKYYFSDLKNNPDGLPDKAIVNTTIINPENNVKFLTMPYTDYNYYRGQLLKTIYYGENGDSLKVVKNNYGKYGLNSKDRFVTDGEFENPFYKRFYKINLNQYLLSSTEETDYLNSKPLQTKTDYFYDTTLTNNLLSSEQTLPDNSKGKAIYKYATDIVGSGDLIQKNMFGIPLEITNYKNNIPVSKAKLSYSSNWAGHNKLLPKQSKSILINTIDTSTEIADDEIIYDQYDTNGNLLEYHTKSGVSTSIIWAYDQTAPIVKVEGIGYSALLALPGMSAVISDLQAKATADIDDSTEQVLNTALDNFRKNQYLTNYLITTYTYNPLVGISSITSPNGIRDNYKYNSSTNRLEKITTGSNEILKEFKINFTQPASGLFYNDEMTKYFAKQNCPSGFIGEQYLYIVPEKRYSSLTSKADANQMALADINNNGQIQTNQFGNCIPDVCTFESSSSVSDLSGSAIKTSSTGVKVSLYFLFPYSDLNLQNSLSNGLNIGKITGSCVPASIKYISNIQEQNRKWSVQVTTLGDVILKYDGTTGGTASAIVNLSFTYNNQ